MHHACNVTVPAYLLTSVHTDASGSLIGTSFRVPADNRDLAPLDPHLALDTRSPMHESGAITPSRGCRSTRPTYHTIFLHTTRKISLHPPVDESGCSCPAQGAPSFYIMLGRSSVLMSLSIEDETSISRLISLHPTCLRSRLQ